MGLRVGPGCPSERRGMGRAGQSCWLFPVARKVPADLRPPSWVPGQCPLLGHKGSSPATSSTAPSSTFILRLLSPWASPPILARSLVTPLPTSPTPPPPSHPCSHPSLMPRVNKPSISCAEKEHTAFARLIHPELLSQPLPGPLACSLHPLGPAAPPPETLLSISSLPHWSQLLSLTVFSLVVYFLPFPSTSSLLLHSFPDWGLLWVASQGCPAEECRKEAQSGAPMSPSRCLSLLAKAWDLQGKRAAVSCSGTC